MCIPARRACDNAEAQHVQLPVIAAQSHGLVPLRVHRGWDERRLEGGEGAVQPHAQRDVCCLHAVEGSVQVRAADDAQRQHERR